MQPLVESLLSLGLLCGSSVVGFWLRRALSDRHFNRDTLDSMRLVITMLVTFAALVLGLLTAGVKARFDNQSDVMRGYAVQLIELNQRLREFGPDADAARTLLRAYTAAAIVDTWPDEPMPPGRYPTNLACDRSIPTECRQLGDMLSDLARMIDMLPSGDLFHEHVSAALRSRMTNTLETRWTLIETAHSTVSWPFLGLLVFWLMLVFAMFGLSAPRNRVVYATILCCGLSVASSLYIILDFDTPYHGLLALPSQPLRDALQHMDALN
ncbi:hypothetical protein [Acidisphaera sp. S103]|uniref:bestrophin-like domain n=1 Tax=Acidisphaera sp. S103 TaxID=1747223 RepID=UPI00131DD77F|nr:hypothetical protein [Acidisphaera sp. S103]